MQQEAVFTERVDHIPVVWVEPEPQEQPRRLVIWLPGFSGTKEGVTPFLQQLAQAGFLALAFDPWQHGERGTEPPQELGPRVFGNFRRYMWPIIGQTALDSLRVIDWALTRFGLPPVVSMGGFSMGGDIAVTVAGLDARVRTVVAMISTPDWLRPQMQGRSGILLPPGEPDHYAQFFYDHMNPLTHLSSYAHQPAITFECGAVDTHIPPGDALRFEQELRARYPDYGERLRVQLHPGLGHEIQDVQREAGLAWLARWS